MIKVQVGDIIEVSLLGGAFMDTGEVVEIIPFCGQNDILVKSHRITEDNPVCFSERQVSRVISRASERDSLESIIDEITRG